jgi:hypothetical protein
VLVVAFKMRVGGKELAEAETEAAIATAVA